MLVPDKDPHIIEAEALLTEAHTAAEAQDYPRVTALTALAQAHVALSRHSAFVDGISGIDTQLTQITEALVAQGPL